MLTRAKLAGWARRYLPLEIAATLTALIGGFAAAAVTGNAVIVAYAGAWCENIGYYSCAFARELRALRADNSLAGHHNPGLARECLTVTRRLVWEFGLAELIDSFVSRPFCMFAATKLLGSFGVGIIIGKLAADVLFYGIAIVFYEVGKRWR